MAWHSILCIALVVWTLDLGAVLFCSAQFTLFFCVLYKTSTPFYFSHSLNVDSLSLSYHSTSISFCDVALMVAKDIEYYTPIYNTAYMSGCITNWLRFVSIFIYRHWGTLYWEESITLRYSAIEHLAVWFRAVYTQSTKGSYFTFQWKGMYEICVIQKKYLVSIADRNL